jgi:hypothetical protein
LNVVVNQTANTASPRLATPVSIPLTSLFPSGSVPDRFQGLVDFCDTNVLLHFAKGDFLIASTKCGFRKVLLVLDRAITCASSVDYSLTFH